MQLLVQRGFDIFFSCLALLVLAPFLLPVVVALRFTGEGEIFYIQQRIGIGGRLFGVFKFATMLKGSSSMATGTVTIKNDPRILPMGRILRKTKINELPQLMNILIGDMSVVGPRPQTQRCFNAFPKAVQNTIVRVRPGLSGVGSIVFRDEEKLLHKQNESLEFYDEVIAPYKGKVEEWYVKHREMHTYFAVILVTVWIVIFPKSDLNWRIFSGLPLPPDELKQALNYSEQKSAVYARVFFWLGSMALIILALLWAFFQLGP